MNELILKYKDLDGLEWDEHLKSFEQGQFNHSHIKIYYDCEYLSQSLVSNESFFLISEEITICQILYVCKSGIDNELSYNGGFLPGPLITECKNRRNLFSALKHWNDYISKVSRDYSVINIKVSLVPLVYEMNEHLRFNWLLKFGYKDNSFNTQIIPLTNSIEEIKSEIDPRVRNYIRRVSGSVVILDSSNILRQDMIDYQNIHMNAAGRLTRSSRTFEIMYDWIKEDKALLAFYELGGVRIAVVLVTYFAGRSYYGSGATLRDYESKNGIGEKLHFTIIDFLKTKGIRFHEMGYQYFLGDKSRLNLSQKDISISRFKQKFGGITTPVFAGIREEINSIKN
jgi:hypothetical protein